jgi:hypothetical protein
MAARVSEWWVYLSAEVVDLASAWGSHSTSSSSGRVRLIFTIAFPFTMGITITIMPSTIPVHNPLRDFIVSCPLHGKKKDGKKKMCCG